MDATTTMLKLAYLKGVTQAANRHADELGANPELLKEAFIGKMVGGALKWGVGKPLQAAGGALWNQGAKATGALLPRMGREAWRLGKNLVGAGYKDPKQMSTLFKALTLGGRNVPAQMLQYGALSGAMGGLTGGQPGEGWSWSGAGKGFLGGAAGGLAWAGGGRAVKAGLGKMLTTKPFQSGRLAGFANRAKNVSGIGAKGPSFWGQRVNDLPVGKTFGQLWKGAPTGGSAQGVMSGLGSTAKDIGIKAGLGTLTGGGALGASLLAESGISSAMNNEQSVTSPESMAARGAFAMSPYGRMGGGYY